MTTGRFNYLLDEAVVYHTFLTDLGGITPKEVDELDFVLVQELLYMNSLIQERKRKEKQR